MTPNNYNYIAFCYDFLGKIVFGNSIHLASVFHFNKIHPGSRILILGGGTGRLLKYLPKSNEITYLDKSKKMLDKAKRGYYPNVKFIQKDFLLFNTPEKFDVIVCPFFLDLFATETLQIVIRKIKGIMSEQALLFVSDFQINGFFFDGMLLKFMHIFFAYTTNLESSEIQHIDKLVTEEGLTPKEKINLFRGLIFTNHYELI